MSDKLSIENLREQVRKLAQDDKRFTKKAAGAKDIIFSSVYVPNLNVPKSADESWSADIEAMDGKTYEVSFTLDAAGNVTLGKDAKEVARNVTYEAVAASALAALPELAADGSLPADIQVFPPGKDQVFTLHEHPGKTFKLDVDATVAARAQASLEEMLAAEARGNSSLPFADKNHEDSEATFHPVKFFWAGDDPKAGGVRVQADWTPFGAQLVKAKAFKYFSGNFLFSPTTKKFLGLISQNIGGLVNRPGFAAQQAFAKADSSTQQKQQPTDTMITKEEIGQIVTEALKPIGDRIGVLEAKAKGTETAPDAGKIINLEERLKKIEDEKDAAITAQAKADVQQFIKDGKIASQDTKAHTDLEATLVAEAKAGKTSTRDLIGKTSPNPAFLKVIEAQAKAGATDADKNPPSTSEVWGKKQ